ncbi:MAG: 1,4-dihydroxy-2-naphthoate polyprenyltransferase [Chloroflexi bacterium]|nr:1,4-dihydroxy-2-naphthoate polyprenyltransferase [Chloroflexota bacterium]
MTQNRWQTWMLAIRPKTLPAVIGPVLAGWGVAWHDGVFRLGPALAALVGGLLLQIGANLANDVADFHRGADTSERLGPVRVTQAGLLSPKEVTRGMWVAFGLAALVGIYLIIEAGWPVVLIGLTAILAAIGYTGGPMPYGYYGLGDLFVFIYFGLAAVVGTYFVQARTVSPAAWWAAVPLGLLAVAILVVNNLRDIPTDRKAGKRTLAVLLGARGARLEYDLCLVGAYGTVTLAVLLGAFPPGALLTWLSLPWAWRVRGIVHTQEGRALNPALGKTGQLVLLFGALLAIGMAL